MAEQQSSSSSSSQTTPPPPHLRGENENAPPGRPQFQIHANAQVQDFFATNNVSAVLTAYKSNLVFTFGATDTKTLGCFYSEYDHPMAAAVGRNNGKPEVWLACQHHLVRCCDAGGVYNTGSEAAGGGGDFTSTFVPRQIYGLGSQDVHMIYPQDPNRPFYVSTRFSALCQLDPERPDVTNNVLWKPPFVSEVRPEDRCHLNDVCFVDGLAKYACCVCESDAHDGWRDHREGGGVIVDVQSGKIIARGLSMPHSPRWFQGKLWVLNSGTGELGIIEEGSFVPKVFVPGFLRGLQFIGRYAVIGSSLDRHEERFKGLALGNTLEAKKTSPVCGLFIVDLANFSILHKIEIKGNIHEIYDVILVPGRRARILGLNDTESKAMYNVEENFVKPKIEEIKDKKANNEEKEHLAEKYNEDE